MRHELCISSNAELRCHWLLQICLMNFYGHEDKYANEPKTIVQELYKCFVAVVTTALRTTPSQPGPTSCHIWRQTVFGRFYVYSLNKKRKKKNMRRT